MLETKRKRGWYWKVHGQEYQRASIKNIKRFIGWNFLLDLIEECNNTLYRLDQVELLRQRDKGLIAALFLTGGRIKEVVQLRKANFDFETGKHLGVVVVKGMKLVKRFEKIGEWMEFTEVLPTNVMKRLYKWDEKEHMYYRRRWRTEPLDVARDDFPIWLDDRLFPFFKEWFDSVEDYLFPAGKIRKKSKLPHLSTVRCYQIVRGLGGRLGTHLYDHWFRAQRASQLVKERKYNAEKLLRFFGWEKYETGLKYARLGWEDLV